MKVYVVYYSGRGSDELESTSFVNVFLTEAEAKKYFANELQEIDTAWSEHRTEGEYYVTKSGSGEDASVLWMDELSGAYDEIGMNEVDLEQSYRVFSKWGF